MPDVIAWDTAPLPQRALDLVEVAAFLKCSDKTIYREAKAGRLRGFKVRHVWRFMPEDVLAYTRGEVA